MDWFRMYSEFSSDPKVQMMSEAMQRRLVMLFCLQCSNGIETFHVTERETSIAFAMRVSEQDLAETKDVFMRRGFIDSDWNLLNWGKRQYESDSSTERVRRYREKQKRQAGTNETLPKRSSNALEQNRTDTEQKKEEANASSAPNAIALDAHGKWTGISDVQRSTWSEAYPALSLDAELSKAAAWVIANPKNKKSNYARFLTNWLCRAQDAAPPARTNESRGRFNGVPMPAQREADNAAAKALLFGHKPQHEVIDV